MKNYGNNTDINTLGALLLGRCLKYLKVRGELLIEIFTQSEFGVVKSMNNLRLLKAYIRSICFLIAFRVRHA